QLTIRNTDEVKIMPSSEFLVDEYVDKNERKQKNIVKYIKAVNILDYIDTPLIIYNDYEGIEQSYKFLLEEITNYNDSLDLPGNTKYMNDFYDYINFDNVQINKFNVKNTQNSLELKSQELENLIGNVSEKNKVLNSHLEKNKVVIICLSSRYKANQLIDLLENENLIFTDEKNCIKE